MFCEALTIHPCDVCPQHAYTIHTHQKHPLVYFSSCEHCPKGRGEGKKERVGEFKDCLGFMFIATITTISTKEK